MYQYIDRLLLDLVKQIEESNKQGIYKKTKKGNLISEHKLEKDLDMH